MSKLNLSHSPEFERLINDRLMQQRTTALRDVLRHQTQLLKEIEIDRLRIKRFEELWAAAEFVFAWRDWFAVSEIGQRFFHAFGDDVKSVLCVGKFWLGKPIEPTDRVCHARLLLNGRPPSPNKPAFLYQELHKGQVSKVLEIYDVTGFITTIHPNFLLEVNEQLHGNGVWDCIVRHLKVRVR
ncbi:hypothetical protein KKF05_04295 [Patescibacteria group bacterium]|nr:hypothetical protein [Patescibacteria group bacterium]MBU1028857.1 hypothetical protein [Patescibacteria group bacterium]MBU1915522.1 hypothetical protein [Patescibacteria group bacterium]